MGSYHFAEFELDLDAFALKRGDELLSMQPKALDVLRYLIERRGNMVTKAELLDQLWRDEYVGDAVVAWSVSHIRRALGQTRGSKAPIETVHGRGYRFVAEVSSRALPRQERKAAQVEASAHKLVGRERVMSELRQRVSAAATGAGGLCVLVGEVGVGKTRCLEELVDSAAGLGVRALSGRWPQQTGTPPLWALLSAFGPLASEHPDLLARVRQLQVSAAEQDAPASEAARFRRTERAAGLLRELALRTPIVFVLDDLQWADPDSLCVLSFIAPELHQLPLCVIATLRDGEGTGGTRDDRRLQVLRHADLIPLAPLDVSEVSELVMADTGQRPGRALCQAIHRASGGIPLFVREVVRALALGNSTGGLDALSPDQVRVPALARDLQRQNIRRLPQETFELLAQAAVVGESFDLSLLTALLELEPEQLLDRIEPACVQGQLRSEARHSYRFASALFRSVLYEDLPHGRRMALHRRVAELLSARSDGHGRKGEIANHYYLCMPIAQQGEVIDRARAAGDEAMRNGSFDQAVTYFEWALEAQAFFGEPQAQQRGELGLLLADAQRLAGRTRDLMKTTARLIELGQEHGLDELIADATRLRRPWPQLAGAPDRLARSALEALLQRQTGSAARISALAQLAWLPPLDRDLSGSKELSARALELARQQSDPSKLLEAQQARLFSLSGPDDIDEAVQLADDALAWHVDGPSELARGGLYRARFNAHLSAGRIEAAYATLDQMRATLRGSQQAQGTFVCDRLEAQRHFLDGRFDLAESRYEQAYQSAVQRGVSYAGQLHWVHRLYLLREREGAEVAARRMLGQGLRYPFALRMSFAGIAAEAGDQALVRTMLPVLGDPADLPRKFAYLNVLANLALVAVASEDKARCRQLVSLLSPYATLNTPDATGYYLGSASYFLGLLSGALGHATQAGKYFEAALEHNKAMGYRAGVVRTLIAHGELELRVGRAGSARDLFEGAAEQARALGMVAMLARAEALLA